jgi:hypothetical protein
MNSESPCPMHKSSGPYRRMARWLLAMLVSMTAFTLAWSTAADSDDADDAATGAAPTAVYFLLVEEDPAELAPRLDGLPVAVRLFDVDRVLLEASGEHLAEVRTALPAAEVIAGPLRDVELYFVHAGREEPLDLEPGVVTLMVDDELRIVATPRGEPPDHAHALPQRFALESLVPHRAAELAHPYRVSRMSDPAARARARRLASQVSAANVEAIIRMLSELESGVPSSRYAFNEHFNTVIVDSLMTRMRGMFSQPGDTVFMHTFKMRAEEDSVEVYNLVARRPGRDAVAPRYVLGAHYDAIGRNTEDWDWRTDPAPGADDNGSGVACVMEAARALLDGEYDFGIELALFTAEELGLVGSTNLIEQLGYTSADIIGMVGPDMVGYNSRLVDSLSVITNPRSEWFADLLTEANEVLPAEDALEFADKHVFPTFSRSDHGAFWAGGMDALLLIESPYVEAHNPNYHRVTDTIDKLEAVDGFDMIRRGAAMITAALGQFASPAGDVELTSESLFFFDTGSSPADFATAGEMTEIRMRFWNGGPELDQVVVRAATSITPAREPSGALVAGNGRRQATSPVPVDTVFVDWGAGTWREIVIPWFPAEEQGGRQLVEIDATLGFPGGSERDFSAAGAITVLGSSVRLLDVYVRPNPVRGSLSGGWLSFQLNERADVSVRIFDALGQNVSQSSVGFYDAGRVEVRLDEVLRGKELASGVYIARLTADGSRFDNGRSEVEIKFALAR